MSTGNIEEEDEVRGRRDVQVNEVTKYYGSVVAVDSVSFYANHGEFVSLLGPSGCGKTTTLRIIAGFAAPSKGRVLVGGRDITHLPPNKRNVGLIFQNYALWPHMTVFENIAYGLRLRRLKKDEVEQKVLEVTSMLDLSGLENRYPRELSGGQQQRVAVGRIAALNLDVYLMDEPLSNLDKKLRVRMRVELVNLQKKLGVTTIYVTHDQEEALSMSDKIVLMNKGKIVQIGSPEEIYENPQHEFVADFIGTVNTLKGKILEISNNNIAIFKTKWGFTLKVEGTTEALKPGEERSVFIRPEKVKISRDLIDGDNVIPGVIVVEDYHGYSVDYHVELKETDYCIIVQCYGSAIRYHNKEKVYVELDPHQCFFIKKKREKEKEEE